MSNPVLQRLAGELEKAREIGNYKTLHELETATKAHVVVANVGEVLLMCSNDYQGFAAHPVVVVGRSPLDCPHWQKTSFKLATQPHPRIPAEEWPRE